MNPIFQNKIKQVKILSHTLDGEMVKWRDGEMVK
jgi:hypothetical protein